MKLKQDIMIEQAEKYDSFYLYDESCIVESMHCLQSNLKNTLNGFLRPSLAKLMTHLPPANAEPLFTSSDAFEFIALKDDKPSELFLTTTGQIIRTE